jgi:hypothetical protein
MCWFACAYIIWRADLHGMELIAVLGATIIAIFLTYLFDVAVDILAALARLADLVDLAEPALRWERKQAAEPKADRYVHEYQMGRGRALTVPWAMLSLGFDGLGWAGWGSTRANIATLARRTRPCTP